MFPSIRCPACTNILGRVHPDGSLQVQCPSCRRNFGVVYGKLSGSSSRWEALVYLSAKLPSFYKRRYEFRITTPGRDLKVLKFSTPGREDRVPVRLGDRISLLYSTRGSMMQKLISVHNHTVGRTYRLPSPLPNSRRLLQALGLASVGMFFYILFMGYGFWLTTALATIAFLVATRVVDAAELTTPELSPENREEARLLGERKLVLQKNFLEERIEALRQEGSEHQALVKRLQTLKEKMQQVDQALYGTRIARVDRAIYLLQQRTQYDRHLREQYAQTIRMIEIELETAYLADQLPDAHDFSGAILRKLEELKAIEDRNRTLRFELEANEEVRRLGFGG